MAKLKSFSLKNKKFLWELFPVNMIGMNGTSTEAC